jgi:hypothetical protein
MVGYGIANPLYMKISSAWIFWKKVRDFINRSDF